MATYPLGSSVHRRMASETGATDRQPKELLGVRRWSLVHPSEMQERLEEALTYYAHLKPAGRPASSRWNP
jgi:hypothetical protein